MRTPAILGIDLLVELLEAPAAPLARTPTPAPILVRAPDALDQRIALEAYSYELSEQNRCLRLAIENAVLRRRLREVEGGAR